MSKQLKQEVADLAKRIAEIQEYLDEKPSVKLFVGAKCERRDGSVVEIVGCDDFLWSGDLYPFRDGDGCHRAEDGSILIGNKEKLDIVKVLNPEADPDLKPVVEYRPVNFTDIGKEVLVAINKQVAGTLLGFGKWTDGDDVVFVCDSGTVEAYEPCEFVIPKSPDDKVLHEKWVNVYGNQEIFCPHASRETAVTSRCGVDKLLATIRVQYYEGQDDA